MSIPVVYLVPCLDRGQTHEQRRCLLRQSLVLPRQSRHLRGRLGQGSGNHPPHLFWPSLLAVHVLYRDPLGSAEGVGGSKAWNSHDLT